jgi:hypothetical protein
MAVVSSSLGVVPLMRIHDAFLAAGAREGTALVSEPGRTSPEQPLHPIMLLCVSVLIVVGLGLFQRLSLKTEEGLSRKPDDIPKA